MQDAHSHAGTIRIRPFAPGDAAGVEQVILPVQRAEFGFAITADDQPDLAAIPEFYQSGRGGFWVAVAGEAIVGTLGLKDIGNREGALRKMFVAAPFRGAAHNVAGRLLATLRAHARERGLQRIHLGTTEAFRAAHRFYEKNGFVPIAKEDLPATFPLMAVDTRFYTREL